MRRIVAAQPVRYEEQSDVRENWGPALTKGGCADLTAIVNGEEEVKVLELFGGLKGWGLYTHTLRLDDGTAYHVRLEEG